MRDAIDGVQVPHPTTSLLPWHDSSGLFAVIPHRIAERSKCMKALFYSVSAAVILSTLGCVHDWRDHDRDRDRVRYHDRDDYYRDYDHHDVYRNDRRW